MPGEEKDDAPTKRKQEGITVYLRMRPTKHPSKFYDVGDNEGRGQSLRWDIPADAVTKDGEYINNTKTQWAFKFDQVLPMDISQAQVFDRVGKHVVQNALDGYNSTVFAYGQTGSGKTFTITGGSERYEDRGIIPRALSMIFQAFRERSDCSWSAHVSYMEIYNEQGFDLLNESSGAKNLQDLPRVRMMEDEHGNFHLRNLSMHRATSEEEALNLLFLGDTNRAISETAMNQASSRSHCLFTVFLECRGAGGSDKVRRSKLHLVDLAGSERVHKTKSDGITLNEAKYINTSLFYLEMVIVALNEKSKKARDHIPYRNSMMTSVLRDSLGGNCRTVMIATCSAEKPQTEESISTCRFAQRVALVKNDAVLNEETDPSVTIARLKSEVSTLRAEIGYLKGEAGEGDELTDAERNELHSACEVYVKSRDPDETLRVAPLTLTRIRDCFALLKNMVLQAMASGGSNGDGSTDEQLKATLKERDDEIAILVNMVRQARGGGTAPTPSIASEAKEFSPPSSEKKPVARRLDPREQLAEDRARMKHRLPDEVAGVSIYVEDAEIRDDPKQAWLYFREKCRIAHVLEDNKRVLKEKYTEAKACGEKVNATRKAIAYLKQSIEAIRRERAIEGVVNEDDLQKADPEEQRKIDAIAQEKDVYKTNFESLRRLKTEIEHVQRMLESGRKKLQKEYDEWYAHVLRRGHNKQPTNAWATPPASPAAAPKEEDDNEDVRAFYAAKAELEALRAKQ
mmetsp:Transcript_7414/g.19382  ORF Transcript_7414/g.19382 Transcript_7414/m.19382 type:complete len:741 (-) Transcript_7414:23-2245(-)